MKFLAIFASAALLCAASPGKAQAQNEVYVCTEENGTKEYKNTGATKGCKKLKLTGMSTVPLTPQAKPTAANTQNNTTKNAAVAAYPKVDSGMQKARDSERKRLLQDELSAERSKLAMLKADLIKASLPAAATSATMPNIRSA